MGHMEADKKIAAMMAGLGACARLAPHPWNFTPMMAIGLYSGAKFTKLRTGIVATLAALFLSDIVLGFDKGMWYIYAASLIPVFIGRLLLRRDGVAATAAAALISSLSFFVTTNFMVWAMGHLYPHTLAGLATCFAAAVPFYQNQILGDAFYTVALFGGHALLRRFAEPAPRAA